MFHEIITELLSHLIVERLLLLGEVDLEDEMGRLLVHVADNELLGDKHNADEREAGHAH